MLEINAAFGQEGQNLGLVGRTGENASRRIAFDCEAVLGEFPDAGIVCALRRACDAEAYAKELTAEGKKRLLTLSAADVAAPGSLMIELRAVEADAIRKSAVYVGRIERGLSGQGDAPGNPVADTINSLEARAKAASAAASAAQAVAEEVRAKLEAGEFKGEKGDPGKNGSDADVTAENVEKALGYKPVSDVRVNGASVVADGTANVPIASAQTAGVVRVNSWDGTKVDNYGILALYPAADNHIDGRVSSTVITPTNLDMAVAAAMTDGKGPAWTAAQQAAARERMGIPGGCELVEEITIAEENVSIITRDVDRLCSAKLVIVCPPMESVITANALIYFGDASKPQYIYLFGEIAPTKVGVYRHITLEAELRNNYWRAYKTAENDTASMYPNGSWTTNTSETAPSRLMRLPSSDMDAITKITVNAYPTGAYIPVGTKITIYGVRA